MRSTLVRAHIGRHIAHRERRRTWSKDELLAKPIASAPPRPKRTAGANSVTVPPRSCLDPQPTMTAMRAMAFTWLAPKSPMRTNKGKNYINLSHAAGWGGCPQRERERDRVLAREFYSKNPTPPGAAQAT